MQEFRRSLPEKTRLIVCKNTLLKQAVDRAPSSAFTELSQAAKVRPGPQYGRTAPCPGYVEREHVMRADGLIARSAAGCSSARSFACRATMLGFSWARK